MQKEKSIDYQLRITWLAVTKMYNEQAAKHESTMASAFVLLNIDKKVGTPSTSLGPLLGMEPTSLSRIIKSMEEKELIQREQNPLDGRSILIKLTKKGLETRRISKNYVYEFNNSISEHISKDDLETFFRVTNTVNKLIIDKQIYNK